MSILNDNNITEIKKQVVNNPELNPHAMCSVVIQGDKFADATYMTSQPQAHTRKLNKKEYVILKTGEIKEYKEKDNFFRQKENLMRTMNNIRWLIRHNFQGDADNQLFITLNYREPMRDRELLYKDFQHFMRAVRLAHPSHNFDYIVIAEPTGKGTWHMHLLLKSDKPVLIIMYNDILKYWRKGGTKVARLKGDDVGTYFTAYFTDLIPDELNNDETPSEVKSKARQKGERLKFYPPNFKFYRKSKGIKDPVHTRVNLEELTETFGEPLLAKQYILEKELNENGNITKEIVNTITKIWYQKNHKKKRVE